MSKHQKIISQEQLDSLIQEDGSLECFVHLNLGVRSSKEISLNDNGDYFVYNDVDGSEEIINHSCLMSSFIGKAMSLGSLYKY